MTRRHAKPVYRRPLQEVVEENGGEVPCVFTESLAVLRKRGLPARGLFQGHADERKVRLLERAWDQGQNPLRLAKVQDCHAVAESLLLWLRVLPAPVIPCKLFRSFLRVRTAASQSESLSQLHYLLNQLEPCEQEILSQILGFLHDYKALQRQLGYLTPSLGHTFSHSLLRPYEGPLPMAFPEDIAAAASLIDCMITDYTVIFAHPEHAASVHKPPPRAKKAQKAELAAASHWVSEASAAAPARLAANDAPQVEWPSKHLRVVVVPPYEDAEVCYMEQEDGMLLHNEGCRDQSQSASRPFHERAFAGKLASVPESCPLGSCSPCPDLELEDLVGNLLCGSMESMLFEEDDITFHAHATSLLSCPGYSGSLSQYESTDQSSVDDDVSEVPESPLASPAKSRPHAPHPHLFQDTPDIRRWIASAR